MAASPVSITLTPGRPPPCCAELTTPMTMCWIQAALRWCPLPTGWAAASFQRDGRDVRLARKQPGDASPCVARAGALTGRLKACKPTGRRASASPNSRRVIFSGSVPRRARLFRRKAGAPRQCRVERDAGPMNTAGHQGTGAGRKPSVVGPLQGDWPLAWHLRQAGF